ncbi:caspase domain-containing protein [Amylostereum chailletii]|nr:caspase domain-containing protein [Amylostereum chailletii]
MCVATLPSQLPLTSASEPSSSSSFVPRCNVGDQLPGIRSRLTFLSILPSSASSRLFALIVGLDEYADPGVDNLFGAVGDARDLKKFLIENMNVPTFRIQELYNERATRENIKRCIRGLATHPDIKKGDPILVFYAGHGSEAVPPKGWSAGGWNKKIQMLAPYDFIPSTVCSELGQGIPDITLSILLSDIAKVKGDNITVILDCCHSGSGTRRGKCDPTSMVRGITLPKDYAIYPRLDEDVRLPGGLRATVVAPGHETTGMLSHVLLSACTEGQGAKERRRRGVFTLALLRILREVGTNRITYKDLIARLPDFTTEQTPQCEGIHQTRILFDGKAPSEPRVLYSVAIKNGVYALEAGEAHGITRGAEFEVYEDQDVGQAPLGTLIAARTSVFNTQMRLADPKRAMRLLKPGFALQTRVGEEEELRLSVAAHRRLVYVIEWVKMEMESKDVVRKRIILVEKTKNPHLLVEMEGDHVVFYASVDESGPAGGLTRMPYQVPIDVEVIFPVIRSAADFFWHFRRSKKTSIFSQKVRLECTRLVQSVTEFTQDLGAIMLSQGENLIQGGTLTIPGVDEMYKDNNIYGYKITNSLQESLFASLFYFDVGDLSITSYYQSGTAKDGKVYATLPAGGSLTIGYGSGGAPPHCFFLRPGQKVDVGFLKLFLTTEYVDLSNIPQVSPFDPNRPTARATLRKPALWSSSLVTVVQRRGGRKK